MLSESQSAFVLQNAYLPEHLPQYFVPFSGMEPYLINNCLTYIKDGAISFIGYPLRNGDKPFPGRAEGQEYPQFSKETEEKTLNTLLRVLKDYKPSVFKAILPSIAQFADYKVIDEEQDAYSRINLDSVPISAKTRNMIRRGSQVLRVSIGQEFTIEHSQILLQFASNKTLKEETINFFHRLPDFLANSGTAILLEARCKKTGILAAYNVLEFSTGDYCFFLFNISGSHHWPGSSDLLMDEMIKLAKGRGKKYINTGLSINGGISSFKAKWGAELFLPFRLISVQPKMPWSDFWVNLKKIFVKNARSDQ
jgi:hypothetical protein